MKISEIIGSQIKGADGSVRGYVRGVYSCGGRVVSLACADGEEREFNADFRDMEFTPSGIIFTDKKQKSNSQPVRLGIPAFTEDGKFRGYIKDILVEKGEISQYIIGNKRYSTALVIVGDVAVIRQRRVLKYDVVKDQKVILKKGTEIDDFALKTAEAVGEYVQTQLKSL